MLSVQDPKAVPQTSSPSLQRSLRKRRDLFPDALKCSLVLGTRQQQRTCEAIQSSQGAVGNWYAVWRG